MQPTQNIMHCYDSTAGRYAAKFMNELGHKHLDRILLYAFADENKDKGPMIVIAHAQAAGFATIDVIERRPYADVEYPTTRAYLWLRK